MRRRLAAMALSMRALAWARYLTIAACSSCRKALATLDADQSRTVSEVRSIARGSPSKESSLSDMRAHLPNQRSEVVWVRIGTSDA